MKHSHTIKLDPWTTISNSDSRRSHTVLFWKRKSPKSPKTLRRTVRSNRTVCAGSGRLTTSPDTLVSSSVGPIPIGCLCHSVELSASTRWVSMVWWPASRLSTTSTAQEAFSISTDMWVSLLFPKEGQVLEVKMSARCWFLISEKMVLFFYYGNIMSTVILKNWIQNGDLVFAI